MEKLVSFINSQWSRWVIHTWFCIIDCSTANSVNCFGFGIVSILSEECCSVQEACCLPTEEQCRRENGGLIHCQFKCAYCKRAPKSICIRKKDTNKCLVNHEFIFDHPDPLPIAPLYPNTSDTTFECVTKDAEPNPTSINWYIGGEFTKSL